jgi:hypothetical protein
MSDVNIHIWIPLNVSLIANSKGTIFCDVTVCSLLKPLLAACFHAGILFGLFFYPEDVVSMYLRNARWLTHNGLHGLISQKTVLNITAYVILQIANSFFRTSI